jgi:hypothetical protein
LTVAYWMFVTLTRDRNWSGGVRGGIGFMLVILVHANRFERDRRLLNSRQSSAPRRPRAP